MKKLFVTAGLLVLVRIGLGAYATFASWSASPVRYYVNPTNTDGLSEGAVIDALKTASSIWSTQSAANFSFVYAGTSGISSASNNGANVVMFRPDNKGGVVATTYTWSDAGHHLLDSDIVVWENDAQFFTGNVGCTNGVYLEEVAVHEFGHALGLGHSSVPTATMYPYLPGSCTTEFQSLDPDDIAGVESLYPPSSGGSSGGTGGAVPAGPGTTPPGPDAPAAPTSLTVAVDGSSPTSNLQLSWASSAVNSFGINVERSLTGASFSQIANLPASATSYIDSGLVSGITYYYRVYAYNNATISDYSNLASGQTQSGGTGGAVPAGPGTTPPGPEAPAAPTSLTVAVDGSSPTSSVQLSWVSSAVNSFGINVERSLTGASFSQIANLPASATSYIDSGLESGTTYYYRVYAYNNATISDYSNLASGQTQSALTTTTTTSTLTTPTGPAPGKPGNRKGLGEKK